MKPHLIVQNLKVWFPFTDRSAKRLFGGAKKYVRAVDGVSFTIQRGEIFCLVGESGCGKSTTGNAILRLVPATEGSVDYNGVDILALQAHQFSSYRSKLQKIFQDPYGSLNPRQKILDVVGEPLVIHKRVENEEDKRERVLNALEAAGLTPPALFIDKYPHQVSGGQRQRVVIASAIALNPEFIVADEPVSMLDVSIRAGIIKLLLEMQREAGLSYLFITHDLSLAWMICNRIAVMYLGQIVEIGLPDTIIHQPSHPYTRALASVIPVPDASAGRRKIILEGDIPSPVDIPEGCRFYSRCYERIPECQQTAPELRKCAPDHWVACIKA